jgi:hypothetical protein
MTIQYRRVLADLAAEHSIARPDKDWARPLVSERTAARRPSLQRAARDD